ncbi:3-methyl-2-oxobutanoate hydroxymethyltransferase [Gammaproteobacteria bacterium]|nr:3-methyl-2-oxobutanoate hydroxymethyltransferase [Gammaproteobacteria bacterium]
MQEEQVAEFMQPRAALASVTPFRVMSVMQRAHELERAGKDIVHLEVGEPDFSTAQPIIDAGKAALDAGRTQYTAATGLEALRNKISERYRKQHGLEIPVIGIGAGPDTTGQIMVLHDVLGVSPITPKFVKNFLTDSTDGIPGALRNYVADVKSQKFPAEEHCFN